MKRYSIFLLLAFSMLAALFFTSCIFSEDYAYHYREPKSYSVTVYQGSTWGAYPRSGYYHYRQPNRGPGRYSW
jgi:outer membrane lipoprotein-sorting protein